MHAIEKIWHRGLVHSTAAIMIMIIVLAFAGLLFVFLNQVQEDTVEYGQYVASGTAFMGGGSYPESDDKAIRMLFFGDLMIDRQVGKKIKKYGFGYLLDKMEAEGVFQNYDLIGANLEGAVTNDGKHYAPQYSYDFAFTPDNVSKLKDYGFNYFNIANNHLTDQGETGVVETGNNLTKLDLAFSGCPDKQTGDCSYTQMEIKGKKIGLAGFSMVYGLLDVEKVKTIVSELSSSSDLVLVNVHWGVEYDHEYNSIQKQFAHDIIDAGADMVIGHHPHVVQGAEIYQGRNIFYSLGNFIFDQYFSRDTEEGIALSLEYIGDELKYEIIPFTGRASQVELMGEKEKEELLKKFLIWSK